MSFQIEETFYHIDVHEQEIVGNIKQFVLYGLGRQEAAINCPEVECGLQQKKKKVKPDGSHYRQPAGYSGERAETRQPGLPTISVRGGRHIEN